jgi:lysophospholipase L1-like esterase
VTLTTCLFAGPAGFAQQFELRDGDRVVFVGGTLIEREQEHGYIETALTSRWPDRSITFRNLGWSGDTVFGEARARFGTTADGFQHLQERIEQLKPTVLLVAYGTNESFEGSAGLPQFVAGLGKLLDMLAASGARIVLLSPARQENLGRPLPDPTAHNTDLRLYGDAVRTVAGERGYPFVDLFELLGEPAGSSTRRQLTDNGMHLTAYGYWRAARAIETGLGLAHPRWSVEWDAAKPAATLGTRITAAEALDNGIRFAATDDRLPPPLPPGAPLDRAGAPLDRAGAPLDRAGAPLDRAGAPLDRADEVRKLVVRGLEPGKYTLRIDGKPAGRVEVTTAPTTLSLMRVPEQEQVERLRDAIVAKNRWYFHRWRPQNETYLFGFRKHEQGQNAAEIPQFDPLVADQEKRIAKLRVPASHRYELVRE